MIITIETSEPVSINIVEESEVSELSKPEALTECDHIFDELRFLVRRLAKENGLTYADIAEKSEIKESTVKSFMCGASDSRRVAEKLADVLGISILYADGKFYAVTDGTPVVSKQA